MDTETDRFINSNGGLDFKGIKYRPEAKCSGVFGLTRRFQSNEKGEIEWGWPGLHDGVDLYGGELSEIKDAILCPFDFSHSGYRDWKGRWWGTDVYLYHVLGFRMRISHMYPDEIQILDQLTAGYPVEQGMLIGRAGSCGDSTGRHTHTEIEAWGFAGEWITDCNACDHILSEKYGRRSTTQYTDEEIWEIYDACEHTKDLVEASIMDNYKTVLTSRNDGREVVFLNHHKMQLRDSNNRITTLYSSQSLFGM